MSSFLTTGSLIEDLVEITTSASPIILENNSPTVTNISGTPSTISAVAATGFFTVIDYTQATGMTTTVGTIVLTEGVDWIAEVDNDTTASNLSTAIGTLVASVSAIATANKVDITAINAGTGGNLIALATSNALAVTKSGNTLSGGANSYVEVQEVYLPDATTLINGVHFLVLNNSTGAIPVKDATNAVTLGLINPNGGGINFRLLSNATETGVWSKEYIGGEGFIVGTLAANTTDVLNELSFSSLNYCGSLVEYSLRESSGEVRVGRLMTAINTSNDVSITDDFNETGDMGVVWDASYNLGNNTVDFTYTNLDATEKSLQASIKKFPK